MPNADIKVSIVPTQYLLHARRAVPMTDQRHAVAVVVIVQILRCVVGAA